MERAPDDLALETRNYQESKPKAEVLSEARYESFVRVIRKNRNSLLLTILTM